MDGFLQILLECARVVALCTAHVSDALMAFCSSRSNKLFCSERARACASSQRVQTIDALAKRSRQRVQHSDALCHAHMCRNLSVVRQARDTY